jgi:hypothetical protein
MMVVVEPFRRLRGLTADTTNVDINMNVWEAKGYSEPVSERYLGLEMPSNDNFWR